MVWAGVSLAFTCVYTGVVQWRTRAGARGAGRRAHWHTIVAWRELGPGRRGDLASTVPAWLGVPGSRGSWPWPCLLAVALLRWSARPALA